MRRAGEMPPQGACPSLYPSCWERAPGSKNNPCALTSQGSTKLSYAQICQGKTSELAQPAHLNPPCPGPGSKPAEMPR